MLRVLTLATLYPNAAEPRLGAFVARQTRALAERPGVAARVAAPVGLPWGPLARHPHYARRAALPDHEERDGIPVHRPRYRAWPLVGQRLAPGAIARALVPLLEKMRRDFPFDVIDAEYFWPDGPAAMRLAAHFGLPFSVKARGSDIHHWGAGGATRAQVLAAGRAADGMLAVSAAMRADMIAMGLPGERIRVHRTGIDLGRFRAVDRAAAKAALGLSGPLVATVGALMERKGQRIAIDALAALPGATLMLIGDGPDRKALADRARRRGLEDRVRILGGQPHDAVAALVAAADVMLLPTASEGLANAWVEALACGTPVVTTDVGGAREAIDRPAAGRLAARTPEAMAAAVRDLLADPPAQDAVRAAAERFDWDRNGAELEAHLRALVKR